MSVTITTLEAENVKRIKAVALTPAPTGLTLDASEFAPNDDVAWNRSLGSYLANPEAMAISDIGRSVWVTRPRARSSRISR